MTSIRRYDIPLLPFIQKLREREELRVERARKRKKYKEPAISFVSVNRMYPVDRRLGRKRLSTEGSSWKSYIKDVMGGQDQDEPPAYHDTYECSYVFYYSRDMLLTKSGELREKDVTNLIKAAEDGVFEYLMEKDSLVTDVHSYKRLARSEPRMIVLLSSGSISGPVQHGGVCVDPQELESRDERLLPQ